jgi:hypothetical protein
MASHRCPALLRQAAALLLAVALLPASLGAQTPTPQRGYPDVRSRLLPDAITQLRGAGYRRVRVARQQVDDMPTGVVLWQYPIPSPRLTIAGRAAVPDSTEIVLIVVEPVRRAPPVQRVVDTVFVRRVDTVVVPRLVTRVDTVFVPRLDTVTVVRVDTVSAFRTDTVYVDRVRVDTLTVYRERGRGDAGLLLIAVVVGGLGLGGLGGYALSRLRPPPGPRPPREPARGERAPPDHPAFDPGAPVPVLVDEIITVTRGKAVPHVGRAGLSKEPPA